MIAVIIAAASALFSKIPGLIGDYFKAKYELSKLQVTTASEIELARQKAAGQIAIAELGRAKETLKATGRNFKYFTFFMWFGPFMLGVLYPPGAVEVFHNLASMPEWYVQSCITIMFTVWGIAVSAPVISSIFSNLGNFFTQKRQFKLDKILADKKAFYDALRAVKGYVSGDDVENLDKVFNKLTKKK